MGAVIRYFFPPTYDLIRLSDLRAEREELPKCAICWDDMGQETMVVPLCCAYKASNQDELIDNIKALHLKCVKESLKKRESCPNCRKKLSAWSLLSKKEKCSYLVKGIVKIALKSIFGAFFIKSLIAIKAHILAINLLALGVTFFCGGFSAFIIRDDLLPSLLSRMDKILFARPLLLIPTIGLSMTCRSITEYFWGYNFSLIHVLGFIKGYEIARNY